MSKPIPDVPLPQQALWEYIGENHPELLEELQAVHADANTRYQRMLRLRTFKQHLDAVKKRESPPNNAQDRMRREFWELALSDPEAYLRGEIQLQGRKKG